jgi:NTP pyrophosphatase (non-canonical NTP hydrolase)
MNLKEYQALAGATDQRPRGEGGGNRTEDAIAIPLLGIGGELGTLLTEYKKFLRDGEAYQPLVSHVAEELGDILWYVANLASKFGLDLEQIATQNLSKIEDRWGASQRQRREEELLDARAPATQRLPLEFEVRFRALDNDGAEPLVQAFWNDRPFGESLADNAYQEDGYRYHDAFHLAHAAILGWSPVCRRGAQFDCKRKDDALTDAVEDGGRAIAIEEAIVAYVYGHARDYGWFENVEGVDFAILKTIRGLTAGLEVASCPAREWDLAIREGYRVWRSLREAGGGIVQGDLLAGTIRYLPIDS